MNATTEQLAEIVSRARGSDTGRAQVRDAVLDCFGCILTGAESEVAKRVASALNVGSSGSAAVYGTTMRTAPGMAALINAVAGHAYDFDDYEDPGNSHPTVVLLPAIAAACNGRKVPGQSVLGAYLAGFEVIARIGQKVNLDHYNRGFHSTATIGAIGASAAVANLLQLNVSETMHALSLAVSQASGYTLQFGTDAKPLQAGLAARAGYESACLARAGATAHTQIIESERGFAGLMCSAAIDLDAETLGAPWAVSEYGIFIKPWPACSYIHRLMTAASAVYPKIAGRADQITRIEVALVDFHRQILPYDTPVRRDQALFSIPACVAQILIAGDLLLQHCESFFWTAPQVERLMRLTRVTAHPPVNPNLNMDPDLPDQLVVHLGDEVIAQECAHALGTLQNPLSEAMLARKFSTNTGLPDAIFERLSNWPQCEDFAAELDFAAASCSQSHAS